MNRLILACAALSALVATPSLAQSIEDAIEARLLSGWRAADGSHMAALQIDLAPGWNTYWRAPGDAGIPPSFDWQGSQNLQSVDVEWPSPKAMKQGHYTTIGYDGRVTLPLRIRPDAAGQPIRLEGEIELGICREVCVPVRLDLSQALPPAQTRPDPAIVAALASRPYTAREAGVSEVTCRLSAVPEGLKLTAAIKMGALSGSETAVVEANDPQIWIAPAETRRVGDTLFAETVLEHVEGRSFALQRSDLRITVLGNGKAVDVQGCRAG
ncbi:MAG: protein-disulfide reductase DsbD domain-containing protein [Pseudomonadota bacterium]